MSKIYKDQEIFAANLTSMWVNGNRESVRRVIRTLKNKAQAAYVAAAVMWQLKHYEDKGTAAHDFLYFIHPNNK